MTVFLYNVTQLIKQAGISKNKLLTDLGLNKNSFVNWEKRDTVPSGDTLTKIAEYFNVSTDYLLGNEPQEEPALDETESKILLLARRTKDLPEADRQKLVKLFEKSIDTFLEAQNKDD